MKDLDAYFDAYDHLHTIGAPKSDWQSLRKQVHRAMARPFLALAARVGLLIACVGLGLWGHPVGYLLALATLFTVLPAQIREMRETASTIAGLAGTDELRSYLEREGERRLAAVLTTALTHAAFALAFLAICGLAALLGRDFRPGLYAGLTMAASASYQLLFRLRQVRPSRGPFQ